MIMEPPCYKDNADCTKRKVGCRTNCNEWQTYEMYKKEEYQRRRNSVKHKSDIGSVLDKRLKKYKSGPYYKK